MYNKTHTVSLKEITDGNAFVEHVLASSISGESKELKVRIYLPDAKVCFQVLKNRALVDSGVEDVFAAIRTYNEIVV